MVVIGGGEDYGGNSTSHWELSEMYLARNTNICEAIRNYLIMPLR